ncbi:hypothetical protein QMQ05_04310 [Glutamicibacter ectropisis]|uniref:DUF4878 domain-containing protein n=1 Tax=Glutamicibacter ectropisis TaxID=3046593 RepID=A0AAU6WGU9_9MICC
MTSISVPAKGALITLVAVSVGLIILAAIVVSLRPAPPLRDADTPVGVVQRYVLAYQSADLATAQGLVENGKDKQDCNYYEPQKASAQVNLLREVTTNRSATITVSITYATDGALLIDPFEAQENFELAIIDGAWLITTAPWQMSLCTKEELGLTP